jgi:uncharacterized membrane protein YhaH (DUF805 family)
VLRQLREILRPSHEIGRIATRILDATIFGSPLNEYCSLRPTNAIFSLIVVVPIFAVSVRRLHDVDRSGWWLLMYFTIIGIFDPLLVWKCTKGRGGRQA